VGVLISVAAGELFSPGKKKNLTYNRVGKIRKKGTKENNDRKRGRR
jgi:hypothetical protein